MLNPVTTAVVAASVWAAAALALPANAVAKNAEATAPAATSTDVTARAQATAPVAKRVRKASMQPRRVAAVAAPAPYYSQCFLFWCPSGGRSFNFLMLGVGF